ncbi:MAG: Abi-alpha family protein [Terriglobales bacterium]|jgi:hypothetical protein
MDDLSTEAAKQALQPLGDMLRKIVGPLADEVGEGMGVVARHYRYRLALKMYQKTERMLTDAGIDPHAVPPRLFLPMIENASMQDDEDLHTRWAALLANAAASPDSVHPSFIEVLRQLTPRDAKLLDELYDSCTGKRDRKVQPWVTQISYAESQRRKAAGENPKESFDNLIRLGLIDTEYELDDSKIKVGLKGVNDVRVQAKLDSDDYLTDFAMRFVQACRAPVVTIEGQATEAK